MPRPKLNPDEKLGRRPWYERELSHRVHFNLTEVARERGVIVRHGPHKGKINLQAIMRGTGASYATVWQWLRAPEKMTGVTFDALVRICEFLDCTPGDLLKLQDAVDLPATPLADKVRDMTPPSPLQYTPSPSSSGDEEAREDQGERYYDPNMEAEDSLVRW